MALNASPRQLPVHLRRPNGEALLQVRLRVDEVPQVPGKRAQGHSKAVVERHRAHAPDQPAGDDQDGALLAVRVTRRAHNHRGRSRHFGYPHLAHALG